MQAAVSLPTKSVALPTASLGFALLVILIIALQFGPFIGLLGFRLTGDVAWALGGVVRDMAVLSLALVAFISWLNSANVTVPGSVMCAVVIVVVFALMALRSPSEPFVVALNLRRSVLVPTLFVALFMIPFTALQLNRLFQLLVGTCVVVACVGIAERLAPAGVWTQVLDIESYTAANGFDRFGTQIFEDGGRYFSWDLEFLTGGPVRRMISTYLEPTTLAAAMATMLVLALARVARRHKATLLVVLALVCGVATVSKGFVLFLLALLTWRMIGFPSPSSTLILTAFGCGLAVIAKNWHLDGPLSHLGGLTSAVEYLAAGNWLGNGIGEAGNLTNSDINVGDESGLGNAIGQVGVAGFLPLVWIAAIAREMRLTVEKRRDPGGAWLATWLMFWTVTYLFSASSLGVGGNALGFVALALYLHPSCAGRAK
jgi:hypothetical protein